MFLASGSKQTDDLQQLVVQGVLNHHFDPVKINDTYSIEVFDLFINKLDPNKRFFTKDDITTLKVYQYSIDDQLQKGTLDFFNAANLLYKKRLSEVDVFLSSLFDVPYSFSSYQTLELDPDKRTYLANETAIKQYWETLVEFQVLSQYLTLKEAEVSANVPITAEFNEALEEKARQSVKKDYLLNFSRLNEETTEDRLDFYIDSLINVFDIHTAYFPPEKKEDFDINLSGKLEGIGAVLREEDGFIKVVRILPGSASSRQGELQAEDIILKVGEGDQDAVDIVGMRVKDAVKLIRGKKGSKVVLTVKHPSGDIVAIPIIRDVVEIEETYVKSTIIQDDRYDKQFGYIYLPKFYRDFKDRSARNTTDDVRKQLAALNKSSVDGIVLDLRDNAGGALIDARDTAGLFIEKGPIVQVKGSSPFYNVLKDKDKSVTYSGPLVILINTYSASASEILAAALQDYGRAVIVGSNSFGKGTVQTFVDLDQSYPTYANRYDSLGSLKVTIQKFYRITGESTQNKGVVPDILLPDSYTFLDVGERHLEHPLPWDTIDPVYYTPWLSHSIDMNRLSKLSKKRTKTSFENLVTHIDYVKKQQDTTLVSLNINHAVEEENEATLENQTYKDTIVEYDHLQFRSPPSVVFTDSQQTSYDDWVTSLKKDIYLNESLAILNDLTEEPYYVNHE